VNWDYTRESKNTGHLMFHHNFGKCRLAQ